MVFLRPVIVRSKQDSVNLSADRYDYMRSAGQQSAAPQDTVVMPDYGTPVLPPLVNGQPPPGGAMAPVPEPERAKAVLVPARPGSAPAAAPAKPDPSDPASYRPVQK
jgi:general secretion pathway protein D